MPIEIRELIIKATIAQDGNGAKSTGSGTADNATSANEEIINVSAERILEIIKERNER